jgi:RNA polymerase sigma factor (sigma-70 family)
VNDDPRPLESIYREHSVYLRRLFKRFGVPASDREDLLHVTLVSLDKTMAAGGPSRATVTTWLYTVARNHASTYHARSRARRTRDHVPIDEADSEPMPELGPEEALILKEAWAFVREQLRRMAPERAAVYEHRGLLELPWAEIAALLQMPETTARRHFEEAERQILAAYRRWADRPARARMIAFPIDLASLLATSREGRDLVTCGDPDRTVRARRVPLGSPCLGARGEPSRARRFLRDRAPTFLIGGFLGVLFGASLGGAGTTAPTLAASSLASVDQALVAMLPDARPTPSAGQSLARQVAPAALAPRAAASPSASPGQPSPPLAEASDVADLHDRLLLDGARRALDAGRMGEARALLLQHMRECPASARVAAREALFARLPR